MLLLQENLEPLFLAAGVNLHLAGHTHVTQRQCAAAEGGCVRNSTAGGGGAPATYDFSAGTALNYTSPLTGDVAALPYVPVYFTISNADAYPDVVGNTLEQGNDGGNGAIGFAGAMFSAPNWAYAVLTVVSPTILDVRIMDGFTGAVLDYSRIVQPVRSTAPQPTAYFAVANALSLPAAVGATAGASTAALTGMLFGLRCDMAAASGLPLAATQLANVAAGASASVDVATAMSAALLAANALTNCSRSPVGGLPVTPLACTATGARQRRMQGANPLAPFLTASLISTVASNNPAVAALVGFAPALAAYAAAAAARIDAAVAANALKWTNGELSAIAGLPNFWAAHPFAATATAPATVSQMTPLAAAAPAAPSAATGLTTSQALGLGLGIALPLAAIIALILACAAAMRSQSNTANNKLRADVAARARAPPAILAV